MSSCLYCTIYIFSNTSYVFILVVLDHYYSAHVAPVIFFLEMVYRDVCADYPAFCEVCKVSILHGKTWAYPACNSWVLLFLIFISFDLALYKNQ